MQELADALSREHVQLEFLLFKLVELRQLLAAGEHTFLRWAAAEVSRANKRVHLSAERRLQLLADYCAEAGLEPDRSNLATLAQSAPEPWHTILEDHRRNFRRLLGEIESAHRADRELAGSTQPWLIDILDAAHRPAAITLPGPRQTRSKPAERF